MDGNSKVKGQHPVWKAATLIEEGKNKSARWAELHDFWPYIWVLIESWEVSSGLAILSGRRTMENWSTKGIPVWDIAPWKSLWECKGYIKVRYVNAHQKIPFQNWKLIKTGKQVLMCLLDMATWTMRWVNIKGLQDGMNVDIFVLHFLRHTMPTSTILSAKKRDRDGTGLFSRIYGERSCTWMTGWPDASGPWRLQMCPNRNRHLL